MHVEVCIPIRNEGNNIGRLLGTLKSQSFSNFSVRIFDNASTDNSLAIINEFRDSLDIAIIQRSCNIGQNSNINRVFANCTSEYIAVLSGNDLIQENYIEVLLDELVCNPDASSAYAKSIAVDEALEPLDEQPGWFNFFSLKDENPINRACESVARYCQASNFFALYRKQAIDRAQPQPFRYGGDHVFAAEVALYGKVLYTDGTAVYRSPWPVSGRSNSRTEHLQRLFSKDVERGLAENSKLGKFETLTPTIDMFHGFLNMFRLADIPQKSRPELISMGLQALMKRMGDGIQVEIENLVVFFELVEEKLKPEHFIDRVGLFHMLQKVDECILIARHPLLFKLRDRLSKLYLNVDAYKSEAY